MKYMKQMGLILVISFIGEVLNKVVPIQIPASIYGLIIMFICLEKKIIPIDSVKDTGKFLIEIMPIMFIPAAVGLMDMWGVLKAILVPVASITVISTVVMMIITGRVTQKVIAVCGSGEDAKDTEDSMVGGVETNE